MGSRKSIFGTVLLLGMAVMLLFGGNVFADEKGEKGLSEVTLYVSGMT